MRFNYYKSLSARNKKIYDASDGIERVALPGLERIRMRGIEGSTSQFDLNLTLVESGGRVMGGITYMSALFDATTVARMMGHYRVLLEGIAARPGAPLHDLSIFGEDERRQVLVTWNDTAARIRDEVRELKHELRGMQAAGV